MWTASAPATGVPVLLVAADGAWEAAQVVEVGDAVAAASALEAAASTAARDVAVEVFWPDESFIGVRWSLDDLDHASDHATATAVHCPAVGPQVTVAAALRSLLGAEPGPDPDRVELGAAGAWASVGPEVLWRRGQLPTASPEHLPIRRPDLAWCAHPVAVEITATAPRECWVGIMVSRPRGDRHVLDLAAVLHLLSLTTDRPQRATGPATAHATTDGIPTAP